MISPRLSSFSLSTGLAPVPYSLKESIKLLSSS